MEAEGYIGITEKKIIGAIGIISGLYRDYGYSPEVFLGLCWIVKLGEPPRISRGA